MKRSVLSILVVLALLIGGISNASGQEQPAPKKDTVNMDTDAKPEFYYDVEDEESMESEKKGSSTIILVGGAVVVLGAAAVILLRKKK